MISANTLVKGAGWRVRHEMNRLGSALDKTNHNRRGDGVKQSDGNFLVSY